MYYRFVLILTISFQLTGADSQLCSQNDTWTTPCEKSGFMQTPDLSDTEAFCRLLDSGSSWVHFTNFGKSPQNRSLPLLILDRNGHFTPGEVRTSGNLVLLIQACIHPGEPEGKDAGLILFRDLAIRMKDTSLLKNITVLFIPIFNVDGHERRGPFNRINQNGPEEMGWRTTAQNLNLNRDYVKAEAPEMIAWLQLWHSWMPDFFIDTHTTDGADYQYVITYSMETYGNMDTGLTQWQKDSFIPEMESYMSEKGYPVFPYVQFRRWHDPRSGLRAGAATPMISQGYTALQNRPGMLIETHMLKSYEPRVLATLELIRFTMRHLNKSGDDLKERIKSADLLASSGRLAAEKLPVKFKISDSDSIMVDFLGINYDIVKSDLTGHDWFVYGKSKETFRLPLFDHSIPIVNARLPSFWIIPPEWEEVIGKLRSHHIEFEVTTSPVTHEVEMYRFSRFEFSKQPNEGRQRVEISGVDTLVLTRTFPAGSVIVHSSQRNTRLAAHMLEPLADNSLVSWGFFNAIFEQKEYGETYVMEKIAREMILQNPDLLHEFRKLQVEDPSFSKNHYTMTNWFYKQTPWWDQNYCLYPVGKVVRK
jgi:hypothetical protein